MRILLRVFILVFLLFACNSQKKTKPDPNIPPKFAQQAEPQFKHHGNLWFTNAQNDTLSQIAIEVANTDATREQGLMFRHTMHPNRGMLFIFDEERRQSFWMKNTHIPLDIIFVNAEKSIVHIANNCKPYSLKSIPSFEYAKYVVEVNAGFCGQYGIKVGGAINYNILGNK